MTAFWVFVIGAAAFATLFGLWISGMERDLRRGYSDYDAKPIVTHPDGKRFYRDHLDRWMPL